MSKKPSKRNKPRAERGQRGYEQTHKTERGREMAAVNTVVGLWINCLHHKSIITVVVVGAVLQEYFLLNATPLVLSM
jgi:hypothetical protein